MRNSRHLKSNTRRGRISRRARRGVLAVLAVFVLVGAFAFVAFAVDTGLIVLTQTKMQNAADAAALAASQEITSAVAEAGEDGGDATIDANSIAVANARSMAEQVVSANGAYIDPDIDVQFGKRVFDEASGTWDIQWDVEPYNVVRVTVRRDDADTTQPDGELPLSFGWAVGRPSVDVVATATAFVEARDIAVVLDYSGSMNYDSQFRSDTLSTLGQTAVEANLYDIWEDLGSPTYGNLPYQPDYATVTKTPGAVKWTGPTIIATFSQAITSVKLYYTDGNNQTFSGGSSGATKTYQGTSSHAGKLIDNCRLYTSSSSYTTYSFYDTTTIKQALGLNSVTYPYPSGSWNNYIDYCRDSTNSTSWYDSQVNACGYRRKFGMKTLVEFWIKHKKSYSQTPDLWKTRHYPFHAVKEGTSLLCSFLEDLDFGDHLGLVTYDTNARIETVLSGTGMPTVSFGSDWVSDNYTAIDTIQSHKQAGHYGDTTNIGGGIDNAITLLSDHGRYGARPTIILMTDGNANVKDNSWSLPLGWDWDELTDYDGNGTADYTTTDAYKLYAIGKAKEAVDLGFTVHTLCVGAGADTEMMEAIAFIGGGLCINVPGGTTIAEMEEDVLAAFRQIAANVPPAKLIYDDATNEL